MNFRLERVLLGIALFLGVRGLALAVPGDHPGSQEIDVQHAEGLNIHTIQASQVKSFDGISAQDHVAVPASSTHILSRRAERWTPEEERLLLQMRDRGMTFRGMTEYFPGRSESALEAKYYQIRARNAAQPWTVEEAVRLVVLRYQGMRWAELKKRFPGRTLIKLKRKFNEVAPKNLPRDEDQ